MSSALDILTAAVIYCDASDEALGPVVRVQAAFVADAIRALSEGGFDFLVDLFGTDTGEAVELTYHLRRFAAREDLYLKCTVAYDGEAPSIWRTFPAALYPEREAAELLGVSFPGHPNPKRLLTTDAIGPLLRRSEPIRTAEEVQLPYE